VQQDVSEGLVAVVTFGRVLKTGLSEFLTVGLGGIAAS
jgi:hypothetical protein